MGLPPRRVSGEGSCVVWSRCGYGFVCCVGGTLHVGKASIKRQRQPSLRTCPIPLAALKHAQPGYQWLRHMWREEGSSGLRVSSLSDPTHAAAVVVAIADAGRLRRRLSRWHNMHTTPLTSSWSSRQLSARLWKNNFKRILLTTVRGTIEGNTLLDLRVWS